MRGKKWRMFNKRGPGTRLLAIVVALTFLAGLAPFGWGEAQSAWAAEEWNPATEQPVLAVTGTGIVGMDLPADAADLTAGIVHEKSYTSAELVGMEEPGYFIYSSLNSVGTKGVYKAKGVPLTTLLAGTAFDPNTHVVKAIEPPDKYVVTFNPNITGAADKTETTGLNTSRYYFDADGGSTEVPVIVATKAHEDTGIPTNEEVDARPLATPLLLVGQLQEGDVNNPLFNKGTKNILVGEKLPAVLQTPNKEYTRAELLMLPRYEGSYTFSSSNGDKTDRVRGVPLKEFLTGFDGGQEVEFISTDAYANPKVSVDEIRNADNQYLLAYESYDPNTSEFRGIYDSGKGQNADKRGYLTVYAAGKSPVKMVCEIKVHSGPEPVASPYKHISYDGAPYNLDAITGATLTVEGPGVKATTPISVLDLEKTADANIHQGVYSDSRGAFSYEGVTVASILQGLVNTSVNLVAEDVQVVFKNRWRQDIGRIDYADLTKAASPIILAYGTASADEILYSPTPFVFSGGAGENTLLGNGDGPLKLVYDQSAGYPDLPSVNSDTNFNFRSVAYLYIEEGSGRPGYKHSAATDPAYDNKANTEHLITLTGSALGREVNYTVAQLEAMTDLVHRGEYGLSNTTYWYVNEYEGIKLWDLLLKSGLNEAQYQNDDSTLVSFSAWDNYEIMTQFSMQQLADPNLFYFYEKSPLDIGTDRPTKAQLATPAYQPDNRQGADWTTDANNYPVKKGYPVLLAYGVNGYPYVRDSDLPGFKSGLGNAGGPMRLIYGKIDGLFRDQPLGDEANYAYFYNNGSQQLQRVQEIYTGDALRYSTHLENPNSAYQVMKDDPALTVEILSEDTPQTYSFTLAELESILYGPDVSKRDRDTQNRQEKGYYYYRSSGGGIEDLFEGVNLEYLLTEHIGLQGMLGSVELYSSDSTCVAAYDLNDIVGEAKGKNSLRGTTGLGAMVAFAKNGYPMVAGSNNSSNESPGYVHADNNGTAIRNAGGPLAFLRGQTDAEYDAQVINETVGGAKTYVDNLTKIVVNLEPDPFAHVGSSNEDYAKQNVLFSGAVAQAGGVSLTIGALETKQRYMVTDTYTVDGVSSTYRGLDLYHLLNDRSIGASALMDKVTVKGDNGEKDLTVSELTASGKKVILAYGLANESDLSDAAPLTTTNGGPLRLIIHEGTATECITNVSEIVVSAAALDGWKHNFGAFTQYADQTLAVSGQNLNHNRTYTVTDIEAMDNLFVFDAYKVGSNIFWYQGVDLYKLLLNDIGFAAGLDTSAITIKASDGYLQSFTGTQLKDGINGKPVLVGFGQGTTQSNGLPLVPTSTSSGYDANIDNVGGPLRFVVHDNSGWAVKNLAEIIVGTAGGNPDPGNTRDFNIYGLRSGAAGYSINEIKNLPGGLGTKTEQYKYYTSSTEFIDEVKGAYLYDLLKAKNVSDNALITINATDGYETSQPDYRDIPMAEIKAQEYFVAYEYSSNSGPVTAVSDPDKQDPPVIAKVRMYRNFNDGSNWRNRLTNIQGVTVEDYDFTAYKTTQNGFPNAGVRSTSLDRSGNLWVGTYGGGVAFLQKDADAFTVYSAAESSTPKLLTNFASAVAADQAGGVWFSQNASYTEPNNNQGVGYLKDEQITWYNTSNSPLPDNYVQAIEIDAAGNIWFGSFGGLTKYDVTSKNWSTWTTADGLPAISVNTIVLDQAGGLWIGCYPDTIGSVEIPESGPADTYKGGYAHMNAAGKIDFAKVYEAGKDPGIEAHLLADFWVRGIAVDNQGGAWIVRSGSYAGMANVGGRVDYVNRNYQVTTYTGKELLGDAALSDNITNPEIRNVAVDKRGGLWFATSGAGLFHCSEAKKVHAVYNTANKSWPVGTPMDNIYTLKFAGDRLYVGSSGGIAWAEVALVPPGGGGGEEETTVGDATASTADLSITGRVNKLGYFTLAGLKGYPGLSTRTGTYTSLNNHGTRETWQFEGVYVENLLSLVQVQSGGQHISVRSSDGFEQSFPIGTALEGTSSLDKNGSKMMLAWKENGKNTPLRLVVGQADEEHKNKMLWVSNVKEIEVTGAAGSRNSGNYTPPIESTATEEEETKDEDKLPLPPLEIIDGVASLTVPHEVILEALNQRAGSAASANQGPLTIDAKTDEEVNETAVTLLPETLLALAENGQSAIMIQTNQGTLLIPASLFSILSLTGGADEPLVITMGQKSPEGLNPEAADQIGERLLVDISLRKGTTQITNLTEKGIKIGLPYTKSDNESSSKLLAYYIGADGRAIPIKLSAYATQGPQLNLITNHLSRFAVGYHEVSFADTREHWAKDKIDFLAAREIISGRGENVFDPNSNVTRAEFIQLLVNSRDSLNLQGVSPAGFTDVVADAWYADSVNWACSRGIIQGFEDGTFRPNDRINREQMAVMCERFITEQNLELALVNPERTFADQEQISAWAVNSVALAQQYGLINGTPEGDFLPQDQANRAEAATIISGFINALLSSWTAQEPVVMELLPSSSVTSDE